MRAFVVTVLATITLVVGAAAASLGLKHVAEDAIRGQTDLSNTIAEVRLQDGLEWRAISGSAPPTIEADLAESCERAEALLASATGRGLPAADARALVSMEEAYHDAVMHELELLDTGRFDEATEWDETRVDPLAEALLEKLETSARALSERGAALSLWSNGGLALTVLLALLATALLQRRQSLDRQRHEHDLESEARYRALIDQSEDLVLVSDRRGRLSYLSPAAQRVLQVEGAAPDLLRAVVPQDREAAQRLLQEAVRSGDPAAVDLRFAASEDREFSVSARDLTGFPRVGGIVLTGRDVTKERELDRAKDDFVSTVSHELRTPLTTIRGYVEMLCSGDLGDVPAPQRRALGVLDRNASRLLRLVRELLFLSGVDARSHQHSPTLLDLPDVVQGAVAEIRVAFPDREFDLDVRDSSGLVHADRSELEQVIANLLANAIKFSPAHEPIRVSVEVVDDRVEVTVADRGMGIPRDEQDLVFTRFFRSEGARSSEIPGTGLGLAVCHAIVEAHGGHIRVASTVGVGSAFTVCLPLVDEGALAPAP